MLPEQFLCRMEKLLGEEYESFLESYSQPRFQSLRINHLKDGKESVREKADFFGEEVPWALGGYYYKEESHPGKHPFHEAGVYYIQEASAMAPACALGALPGERILDLCAAPGGKSTQIADALGGQGLLICNEIHPQRAKILSENVERMGIGNALVLNHEPAYLAERFPEAFDRILVDAPCSGEGMFRKNEEAAGQWSADNVDMCAARQREIMEYAAGMLKKGGVMVYSTCTFAPEENEENVNWFLKEHPEFFLEESMRLWPHKVKGEGHFLARFTKDGNSKGETAVFGVERGIKEKDCKEWLAFKAKYLKRDFQGIYVMFGGQLYLVPGECPSLKGLKALRAGLHLGTVKKDRFEPSHALALFLKPEEAVFSYNLSLEQDGKYLKGETFAAEGEKGWYLICVEGYSLGFGKLSGSIMKNHYPKGLRK